jgi:hypothetical protein
MAELETAVREKIAIMTVLLNNSVMGGYGHHMPNASERWPVKAMTRLPLWPKPRTPSASFIPARSLRAGRRPLTIVRWGSCSFNPLCRSHASASFLAQIPTIFARIFPLCPDLRQQARTDLPVRLRKWELAFAPSCGSGSSRGVTGSRLQGLAHALPLIDVACVAPALHRALYPCLSRCCVRWVCSSRCGPSCAGAGLPPRGERWTSGAPARPSRTSPVRAPPGQAWCASA